MGQGFYTTPMSASPAKPRTAAEAEAEPVLGKILQRLAVISVPAALLHPPLWIYWSGKALERQH